MFYRFEDGFPVWLVHSLAAFEYVHKNMFTGQIDLGFCHIVIPLWDRSIPSLDEQSLRVAPVRHLSPPQDLR